MLTTAGCIASWVELAVRLASVDPDLMKLPVKGTVARQVPGQGYGVHLAPPVRGLLGAEHFSRAVIDVLPVEEHNNTGRHRERLLR